MKIRSIDEKLAALRKKTNPHSKDTDLFSWLAWEGRLFNRIEKLKQEALRGNTTGSEVK